jgi:hypothetical protein
MDKKLKDFLIVSKKNGYAAGEANIVSEDDKSYSTRGSSGDFSFHDNWFGGEPFGGREAVLHKGKPYWMMVYYGQDTGKAKGLIDFLRKALSQISEELPLRGPSHFEEGEFRYENIVEGTLEKFVGVEKIFYKGEEVFKTNYAGGLVDRREDQ